jgi:DNA primase
VYLSLDEDEAGQKAIRQAARLLGPKVQIVRMSRTWTREEAEQEKAGDKGQGTGDESDG